MIDDEKMNDSGSHATPSIWRTIWAIVFVVLSVEAILIAAIINSRREINVTKPIVRIAGVSQETEFDSSKIDSYLTESSVIENTTLYYYNGSLPSQNPQAYYDSLSADLEFLAKRLKLDRVELPSKIYLFDQELDEYIVEAGYGDGWITDKAVYIPAQRSAAKQLIYYSLDRKSIDYDPELLDGVTEFIGGFLDFYADHPYESQFEKTLSTWQKSTPITLPLARIVLNDERLGADFVSIPVRQSLIFAARTNETKVLRTGFYRYLLDKYGWDGFAKLLTSGGKGNQPFETAYGKPAADLLKEYQETLDLLPKEAFTTTQAKIVALDMGLLKYSIPDQVIADAETTLKAEVKRFKLPPRDLAQRNDALGRIYLRKHFQSHDIDSPQVKKLASDAEGILLSSNANVDALSEVEHKWLVASVYERLGDYEAADRLYATGLDHPALSNYYIPQYVRILLARRNFQRVADLLEVYLVTYPNDLNMLYTRMACLSRIGKTEAAKSLAQRMLKHPLIELNLHPQFKILAEHYLGNDATTITEPDKDEAKPEDVISSSTDE